MAIKILNGVMGVVKRNRLATEAAFTLIEITIAVFILATSLVVLIGLETSLLGQAVSDRNRVEAMLVARRILAAMESSPEPLPNQQIEGNAKQLLEKFVENVGSEEDQDTRIESLTGTFVVEDWGIPDNPTALKRITLTLSWSENPSDTVTVYYFIPNEAEKVDEVEPVDSSSQ